MKIEQVFCFLDCNSATIDSQATRTGALYVVKLAGIIFGGAVGILLFVFVIFRLCVWKLEKRYDQRDLHWNAGKDNPLRELGMLTLCISI